MPRPCFYAPVLAEMSATPDAGVTIAKALSILHRCDSQYEYKRSLQRKTEFFKQVGDAWYLTETAKRAAEAKAAAAAEPERSAVDADDAAEPEYESVPSPVPFETIDAARWHAATIADHTTFRVVSWNVGGAAGAGMTRCPEKIAAYCRAILSERPDVVVLQEVPTLPASNFPLFLAENYTLSRSSPDSEHCFLTSDAVELRDCFDVPNDALRGAGPRTGNRVPCVDVAKNGVAQRFVSVHAPLDAPSRAAYISKLAAFSREGPPVVLCGDFNEHAHKIKPHVTRSAVFAFTGDEFTHTSNTDGLDFFGYDSALRSAWTMHQYCIRQLERRNTSRSVVGCSDHDAVVLTMRKR